VEQPQGVTDANDRWYWLWDVYFAIVYLAVTVLLFALDRPHGTADRAISVSALSAIGVLYVFLGRPALADEGRGWRPKAFVTLMIALLLLSAGAMPMSSYALFAVIPMIFVSLRVFPAVFLVVTLLFVPAFGSLVHDGPDAAILTSWLPVGVISTAFAVLIGVWIDKVVTQNEDRLTLIRKLEASQAEVSRLSHEAGVTTERERLAGEIHDTLAQGFTSIVTLVQAAESELGRDEAQAREHLNLALRTARENLAESRALVAALAPAELSESSMLETLRRQATRLTEETGVAVEFVVQGDRRPLPTGVEVLLLRTLQESLANVRKHADAAAAEVVLSYQDTSVVLLVTDDGKGFDPSSATSGFGLRGMRSRVGHAGGSLTVTSAVDAGTTVELEVQA
jgi:signal transduction histidine kinase